MPKYLWTIEGEFRVTVVGADEEEAMEALLDESIADSVIGKPIVEKVEELTPE